MRTVMFDRPWGEAPTGPAASRRSRVREASLLAVALAVGSVPGSAAAQEVAVREANGFMLGSARLHAFFDLQSHFVHNPNRCTTDGCALGGGVTEPAISDLYFGFRPGLELDLPGESLELNVETDLEWRQYVGLDNPRTAEPEAGLSGLVANLRARLLFNKGGSFTVGLNDHLARARDPGGEALDRALEHVSNDVGINLEARPGGGALSFSLAYDFFVDFYDRDANNAAGTTGYLDHMRHTPRLKAAWKFLPKTAVFLESQLSYTSYLVSEADIADSNDLDEDGDVEELVPTQNPSEDNFILSSVIGANGNITPRLSLILKLGYGGAFLESRDDHTLTAMANADFQISEVSKVSGGYRRGLNSTPIYSSMSNDSINVRYEHLLFGRLQAGTKLSFSYIDFGDPTDPDDDPTTDNTPAVRDDVVLVWEVSGDVAILDWLQLGLVNRLEYRYKIQSSVDESVEIDNQTVVANDVMLRVTARY